MFKGGRKSERDDTDCRRGSGSYAHGGGTVPVGNTGATDTPTPTATPAVDENGMTLKCPAEYLKKRDGATYGKFSHIMYYSDYCKRDRGATVLLPAGYTEEKKYPVV